MSNLFDLSKNEKFQLADIPLQGKSYLNLNRYRFEENPYARADKYFVYGDEENEKWESAFLSMPSPLSMDGRMIKTFWGQDFLSLNGSKATAPDLFELCLKRPYFITVGGLARYGVADNHKRIKQLTYLDSYLWEPEAKKSIWKKFFGNERKDLFPFPDHILGFVRIKESEKFFLTETDWNPNTIETLRTRKFFQWRFFHKPDVYFLYQSERMGFHNPVYFVVRLYEKDRQFYLKVVDYRFQKVQPGGFLDILNAVENLRLNLGLKGLIISSSLKMTRDFLEENNFKRTDRQPVLTTYPFRPRESAEPEDDFIMSFADSDLDFYNEDGSFVYS